MSDVVKVTTKGQITLPIDVRKSLHIEKDGYLIVDQIGDYILMKKAELRLDEINDILSKVAKEKGITKRDIEKAIKEARKEKWAE